ncbi:AbfB domain-containing protein, partial [Acinetobacter baumannii]
KISLQATTACCTSQYLAHQGTNVSLSNVNGASDQQNATWIVRAGLGKSSCYSFEAANAPGTFLRHSYFSLDAGPNENSTGFAQDATFCPVTG